MEVSQYSKDKGLDAFTIHLQEQRNYWQQPVAVTPGHKSFHPQFSMAPAQVTSGTEPHNFSVMLVLLSVLSFFEELAVKAYSFLGI